MVNNIFHKTITDITASATKQFKITDEERREVDMKPFDFLVVYSSMDKFCFIQLNGNQEERFPLPSSGGRVVIENKDNIKFSSLELVEGSGANATGTVYATFGVTLKNGN